MIESGRLLVLYGSQTFTAQEAAERIWRTSKALGFRGPVQAMDDYPISKLIHEEFAIFVCATTGQGDEPDNMKRFWKFLLRKSLPSNSLAKLKFGVVALGDSSYSKFNFVGKKLYRRLLQLGATPLLDIGLCDYQHDLGHDAVMQPWLKDLYAHLQNYFPNIKPDHITSSFIPRWSVTLLKNENLPEQGMTEDIYFGDGSKDSFNDATLLIAFKTVGDSVLNYKPGDVFNIRPRNSKEDIEDLFGIFETHALDIKPHYRLLVEEFHDGRKSVEDKQKSIQSKKDQLKKSLEENIPIHGDLRKEALKLQKRIEFEDKGPERAAVIGGFSGGANTQSSQDDEYRFAGVDDPKIMITTSREPSARLKMFVKELRGGYEMSQLIHACRANDVTDFIVVHEHRGVPDSLVVCHLPYGPTASFTLSGVVMRHDIPDIGPMSEQFPHLLFHNFKSDLGLRTMSILKYLFPVPKTDSKRVITFANHDDYVCFRQHTYRKMKLYEIKLGTLEALAAADTEWALRPYMNTAAKRRHARAPLLAPLPHNVRDRGTVLGSEGYVFSLLALVSDDKLERDKCGELSTSEGQEDWLNYSRRPRRTVLEVLHDFHKSASKLTIDVLFELFSTIKPRSFSIASSSLPSQGRRVELLVAVVHYHSKLKKPRLGLCSNWLRDLGVGDRTRDAQGTANHHTMHLFVGCRYKERDFHSLWELISTGAYIFISGNAKNMPDNVRDAFVEHVICDVGGLTMDQSRAYLKNMESTVKLYSHNVIVWCVAAHRTVCPSRRLDRADRHVR
ncbi:U3 small nucleolar ribonucleoprotein component [Operophtera brumata]|uniref:U3 small nucleolar ribonucleoprotein component n=1 Tax=Operophtera brumata TaxID=104452 RepID=A0A0L7LRW9_OPEBR|nr:U3 small nucleolar ribonucleoprotein component [Operophtera brumata]